MYECSTIEKASAHWRGKNSIRQFPSAQPCSCRCPPRQSPRRHRDKSPPRQLRLAIGALAARLCLKRAGDVSVRAGIGTFGHDDKLCCCHSERSRGISEYFLLLVEKAFPMQRLMPHASRKHSFT